MFYTTIMHEFYKLYYIVAKIKTLDDFIMLKCFTAFSEI